MNGCTRYFKTCRSFKRHLRLLHSQFYKDNILNNTHADADYPVGNNTSNEENDSLVDVEIDQNNQQNNDHTLNFDELIPQEGINVKSLVAEFLLHLREQFKTSGAACQYVSEQVQKIMDLDRQLSNQNLVNILSRENIDISNIPEASQLMTLETPSISAFSEFSSIQKLNDYIRSSEFFVEPLEVQLGYNASKSSFDTFQYVPILKTLNVMLMHEDVLGQVFHKGNVNDGIIRDFCDSTLHQNNPLFRLSPTSLKIQLYADEFGCANPLGNKQRKYKILGVYFVLGNLDLIYRSRLNLIQLAILCRNTLVKTYGLPSILAPLIKDLKQLETSGIDVKFEGNLSHFVGSVSVFSADNLAAHAIGGFMENFSTVKRICRFCMCSNDELNIFEEEKFVRRTKNSYDLQVSMITEDPDMIQTYGVKSKSPLNNLNFFHVIGGLPPDISHDLFEGVLPETLRHLTIAFIQEGLFTLEQLNEKISSFKYADPDKANKPQFQTNFQGLQKLKFRMTATEMWTFARLYPLMVGTYVPEDHSKWSCLMILLDVLDLVCARSFSEADLYNLKRSVEEFLKSYAILFPENNIKPKFHYLLHYASEIRVSGPPCTKWCLRFEGKHNFFKEISARSKNRINLTKTMAYPEEIAYFMLGQAKKLLKKEAHFVNTS